MGWNERKKSMSLIQLQIHERENTPVGRIVRFSFLEGESVEDLCWCGTICMSAEKFEVFADQIRESTAELEVVEPVS